MGVIETGKEIAKLAQQLGSIEIQQKVIDLQAGIIEMQEQMQKLRQERDALKSMQQIDDELVLRENAYWRDAAPESRRGPFCTNCYDADRKLIRLKIREDGEQRCPQCNQIFPTTESNASAKRRAAENKASAQRRRDMLRRHY